MIALFSGLNIAWRSGRHSLGVQVDCFHLFCPSCSVLISYTHELLLFLQGSNLPVSQNAQQDAFHFCDACPQGRWGVGRGLGPMNNVGITLEVSSSTSCSKQGRIGVWSGCSGPCPARFWKSESVEIALCLWAPAAGLSDLVRISLAAACPFTEHIWEEAGSFFSIMSH